MKKLKDLSKHEQQSQIPEPQDSELKKLPKHLEYVFLGEKTLQPTIINSSLSVMDEYKLLRVLMKNKTTLGWSIKDLNGISLAYCMH